MLEHGANVNAQLQGTTTFTYLIEGWEDRCYTLANRTWCRGRGEGQQRLDDSATEGCDEVVDLLLELNDDQL